MKEYHDAVNHPSHYTSHPSGVECIQITEHMNFNLGNVVKYLWRAGIKDTAVELEDLKKAQWYLNREIERREKEQELEKQQYEEQMKEYGCRLDARQVLSDLISSTVFDDNHE